MPAEPSALTRTEDDRRDLIRWAVACADRVLPLFEVVHPDDTRPRDALAGALAFSRAELKVGPARALAVAAHAAARDAITPSAAAAARACGHAVAVAHMAAHARHVPVYSLKAIGDPEAAAAEAIWQRSHVPTRFADYVYPSA